MSSPIEAVARALPGYEIGGELGRGGCGVVLAGRHRQLDRQVAIKQLPGAFSSDKVVRGRFTAEARLLASLDHPHVVPVYDFVDQDGLCLLVMELLPGGTVWSQFTTSGYTATDAIAVSLACAAGLKAAHDRNILHRDVKPENLMFSASGSVKVTDFGIAKVVGGNETLATRNGEVLGTPAYIAPEQARGHELTAATDVYALATMLYELLSGVLPFSDADPMVLMYRHAFEPPIPLLDVAPSLPPDVAEVVMRGLATDPADRYPTAEAFGTALAAASTSYWGSGWLSTAAIPVLGAETMISGGVALPPSQAMPRTTPGGSAPMPDPTAGGTAPPPPPPVSRPASAAPPTLAPGGAPPATPGAPPPATPAAPPPGGAAATVLGGQAVRAAGGKTARNTPAIRPAAPVHARGAALADVSEADLVPLKQMIAPSGRVPFLIAAVLALGALAIALLGLGAPSRGGSLATDTIQLGGLNATANGHTLIDLTAPLQLRISGPIPAADHARISLQVLGVPLESRTAVLYRVAGGATATFTALGGHYLFGGRMTAQVALLDHGAVGGSTKVGIRTKQPALATAVAAGDLILLLFAFAYLESFLRAMRRGKSRVAGTLGAPLSAGLLAIVAAVAGWLLLGTEPTVIALIVSVALALAAGAAAVVAAMRVGRRRRPRKTKALTTNQPRQR